MALTTTSSVMRLDGMDGLLRALRTMPDVARQELKHAVSVTTFALVQGMRALVPRDTGLLLSQISSRLSGTAGLIEIGVDGYYWPFVEFGTVRMQARPFIRPAAESEAPNFERRLQDVARTIEHRFYAEAA